MGGFFAELKRRHIYRVAAAYAVVAWVLIQLVNNLEPMLKLPDWVGPLVLVLLVVGFPVALIFAWTLEMKSHGAAESTSIGKTDAVLIGAIGLVIALIAYEQISRGPPPSAQATFPGPQAATVTPPQTVTLSIAVLPFANMSGDASQEFFSDGMTEEITSALAKLKGLKVIGRTSAFQYKGQSQDLRAIGQALSAGYLIEGSVRKAGDQVRITAQLIKADDGTHLWTENYDRQLSNIFATQEDIAQAIARALRIPLGLTQGETLVSSRTGDLDSYQQYLRGKALIRNGFIADAVKTLEPVVAADPNFAPAWAYLARAYNGMPVISPVARNGPIEDARRFVQLYREKSEMAAREALRLDPKLPVAYWALGQSVPTVAIAEREDLFRRALALDPNDPDLIDAYSVLLASAGLMKKALPFRQQLRMDEPLVAVFNVGTASAFRATGDRKTAISIMEGSRLSDPIGGFFTNAYLAQHYAADGRFRDAADALLSIPPTTLARREMIEQAANLIRRAPVQIAARDLPAWGDPLHWVYAYAGAPERMLEYWERNLEIGRTGVTAQFWLPEFAPVRLTERFKAFARKAGLLDYWKARGWPDLCRPLGSDDFECD